MKYHLTVLTIALISLLFSGCGGTGSSFYPNIPNELEGDWNLTGTITANDGSYQTDIDQNFEIRGNKLYLEGSDEIWDGSYYSPYLNIRFDKIVQDEVVVGCGKIATTAKATIMVFLVDTDEPDYDGIAIGLFETDSECDGITRVELGGSLVLERI